jgi:hypothetical protein
MRHRRRASALLALAVLAGCAVRVGPSPVLTVAEAPALQRLLDPRPGPSQPEWLGGDVATSVPLDRDRFLWIFGDTLLGRVRRDCPPPTTYCGRDVEEGDPDDVMIANSVGIMRRRGSAFAPLTTAWRTAGARPAPVFEAGKPGEFLWPLAALRTDGPLLVATSAHTRAFGLFSLASVLVRVHNPDDPPARWRYDRFPLPNAIVSIDGRPQLSWATALVADGKDLVHVVGEHGTGSGSQTVLARFSTRDVAEPAWRPALEYLQVRDGAPVWERAFDEARLYRIPGLPGISETTFHRARDGTWRTYRVPPGTFDVRLYVGGALTGPWRDAGVVYRIPAPWSTQKAADGSPAFAAYAAKAHPELGTADAPALTYNVNVLSGDFAHAIRIAEHYPAFYVPRVLATP